MGSFCHCCNLPRFNFRCDPPDSLSGSAPSASKLWQQLDFALNRKSIVVDCCDLDQESRVFSVCCAHSVESRIFISIPDSLPSLSPLSWDLPSPSCRRWSRRSSSHFGSAKDGGLAAYSDTPSIRGQLAHCRNGRSWSRSVNDVWIGTFDISYATNRDRRTSRRLMTSSILLTISSIDLVCAGEMTSKEDSHLEQCQK
jgi:hypothetical protein